MQARQASLRVIGERLRDDWHHLVLSPLPERLQRLIEQLDRAEMAPPGTRQETASQRSSAKQ
jgi:hypothetical protein